jgi:hypothetical protein
VQRTARAAALAAFVCVAPAHAQRTQGQMQSVCFQNFVVEGTPRVTAINFRTFRDFPNLDQRKALGNLRSAMLAEGFSNIGVDAEGGALTAVQETSGSGRPQTLRLSARRVGNGTRVDGVFMIQAGQTADTNVVRTAMCRVVDAANL